MGKINYRPYLGYVKCEHCDAYVRDKELSIRSHIGYFHKEFCKKPTVFTIECLECKKMVANSMNVLGRHLRKEHSMEYIDYVIKYEHGGIRPTCKCGGEVKFIKGGKFNKFCSTSCFSSGQNNPMSRTNMPISPSLGLVRTEEQLKVYSQAAKEKWQGPHGDKLREILRSEEYVNKQRDISNHLYATTDQAQKISDGLNKFWNSDDPKVEELRKAASDRAIEMSINGILGDKNYHSGNIFNSFTNQMEYMHSGWETEFLRRCVANNTPVTKKHSIRIPYKDKENKDRTYIPDFVTIDGSNVIHEIKGQEDDDDFCKYYAAAQWSKINGYKFIVHKKDEFRGANAPTLSDEQP